MSFGKKLLLFSIMTVVGMSLLLYWHIKHQGPPDITGNGVTVVMYCAAGVKSPVLEAAKAFEQEFGITIQFQYGGSGSLLANLQVAKSGDLYLAGDSSYTDIAKRKGVVKERIPVAYMKPVIAVKNGNPKKIKGLEDLYREDIRVALGNPEAASIGKQTKKLLSETGHWEKVKEHITQIGVFKPTVPEVANDIKLGAVDAGIIWDATVKQYPELEAVHVDVFDQASKQVTVGVLSWSKNAPQALLFARYLNSEKGNAFFNKNGYQAVDGDKWSKKPEITFYCGAVNKRAVDALIEVFQLREGCVVNTSYNGCGILTGQMRTINQDKGGIGFPDVYMACDRYYLDNVQEWFQEDVDVSDTQIVIAVQKGNPKGIETLEDLTKPGMRVAVGQPEQCTIGALSKLLLEESGFYNEVMKNVKTQTASSSMLLPTVATKSVDAAFVYKTDTMAEADMVDAIEVPSKRAVAIQPLSIAKSSQHKYLGRRLKETIMQARENFEEAGFNFRIEDTK